MLPDRDTISGHPCKIRESFVQSPDCPIQLKLVDLAKDLAHSRAWFISSLDQVTAKQQWLRRTMLDAELACSIHKPIYGNPRFSFSRYSARFRNAEEQIDINPLSKPAKVSVRYLGPRFVELSRPQLLANKSQHLRPDVIPCHRVNPECLQHL